MFKGQSIRVEAIGGGIVELCFDRGGDSINKFDARTVDELRSASAAIATANDVRGVLVSSAKNVFIVGADIFEFTAMFALPESEIAANTAKQNLVFTTFEDLPVPIVTAINGLALGGGFEMALASDYRVIADTAQVGLPEVNLGLFPGFGGTVRLARLIDAALALDWIASGRPQKPEAAKSAGAVDAVTPAADLRDAALVKLREAIGSGQWKADRVRRRGAVSALNAESFARLEAAAAQTARHFPAASAAAELIGSSAKLSRDDALVREAIGFARIAKTPTASALVQLFINDQAMKKKARAYAKMAHKVERSAVLGAGIMGGGIAYTSAARGTPVLMKDIAQSALDLGMGEARKLLDKQVQIGRLKPENASAIAEAIVPTLDYSAFNSVDVVVEAIVENINAKKSVLAEVEKRVRADAILASNTSSLSIAEIGGALARPENFVGMHFFNPVPVMPLVEVIRGPATSDIAAATIAGYAAAMGKTPVVVKDCPGFLVNRILTAYFVGFLRLVHDGGDFERIDRVMETYGWPMGPAYLQDVIGMDTSSHVVDSITIGYPERMHLGFKDAIHLLAENGRYGQKNGAGFYRYEADEKGRPQKRSAAEARELIAEAQAGGSREFSDQEIIDRLMLPMINEAAVCLEQGVAGSAAEIDMSLILGLGFPRQYGGALKYADILGLPVVIEKLARYESLGGAYRATRLLRDLAQRKACFFD
ncbi:MAG: Multifunctional fatty acid oxidation complex subunit alpha [Hydrocarboniphaga sp.]|uniref:fatty acid oxidation complex subunit alpha FadB n=1 Tax=Hydrocarboniphaga sp. TaxID=2033016 RepID=UPI00261670A5|nr:fatty acid oxidation complex subunit alpha FadB [Hydrocarboniphaga sp.]MDB5969373.1 Multifunctional fatty acid oxidation complex subunit alpha [Hydrocarboniphaga sp.]